MRVGIETHRIIINHLGRDWELIVIKGCIQPTTYNVHIRCYINSKVPGVNRDGGTSQNLLPSPTHLPMPDLTSQPLDPNEPTYCLCEQVGTALYGRKFKVNSVINQLMWNSPVHIYFSHILSYNLFHDPYMVYSWFCISRHWNCVNSYICIITNLYRGMQVSFGEMIGCDKEDVSVLLGLLILSIILILHVVSHRMVPLPVCWIDL